MNILTIILSLSTLVIVAITIVGIIKNEKRIRELEKWYKDEDKEDSDDGR